ncbi:MAG: cation:proton antiporter [Isosphaeraceae bacterium]|nr:cation:proton antiporter [Isosphaeraceae bacterium]
MPHETTLISTVAVSLAFAFAGGWTAWRVGLPPLVGYLAAGIAVGPFTPGFVADVDLAPQLAEIGVILLMFGVGMHFSVGDLLAVRATALPGAIVQTTAATALGAGLAFAWGWGLGSGLVFGLALSVASTVVLLRSLEARGLLESEDGRIAVGWLIVEDLLMVLALVLLPAVGGLLGAPRVGEAEVGSSSILVELIITFAKVGAFVVTMLVIGRRVFPWLLRRVDRTGSRELFTLAVIVLSLGVAFGSAKLFGVSFALGAFFAGVVVHESEFGDRAASELRPLQDLFAALFFVSVGMLFDPGVLLRKPVEVLATLAVIVLGKSIAAFGIVLALRKPIRTASIVSAALAQIGEFSFILASVGSEMGLLSSEARNLIVAGAMLSITLNPFWFRLLPKRSEIAIESSASSAIE